MAKNCLQQIGTWTQTQSMQHLQADKEIIKTLRDYSSKSTKNHNHLNVY